MHAVLGGEGLNTLGRCVAKAERLVQTCAMEVPASNDVGQELASRGVTGKYNTVGVVGI